MIERIDRSFNEQCFRRTVALVASNRGMKVEGDNVVGESGKYRINSSRSFNHSEGYGGSRRVELSLLALDDKDVIELVKSRHYSSWSTYSDDSADYQTGLENSTTLLREEPFAREVYDRLKQNRERQIIV